MERREFQRMKGLTAVGTALMVIGGILMAMPAVQIDAEVVHEQDFILTEDSMLLTSLKLSEGTYEIWLSDIDGWQQENEIVGIELLDPNRKPLAHALDDELTVKLVGNITMERHSTFVVRDKQLVTINTVCWDPNHYLDDDRIYIKRLASEGERPLFVLGVVAIVIGLVIALVGIWTFVKRKG
jgi:hypothetical protein